MAIQFSCTQRAVAVGVASAGLLIGAFTLGAGQGSATADGATGGAALTAAAAPEANSAVRSITAVLRRSGVTASDIQTSGLSVYPNYSGSSGVPSGYQVSEQLTITLRRLSAAGSQISAAAHAGGNATVIDGVSLNRSDTSTLLASARARAVADAKAKATAYARALGRPLGPVVSMSEIPAAQPYPLPEFATPSASRAASSVPVHPGTQQLSVTVTAVFDLG